MIPYKCGCEASNESVPEKFCLEGAKIWEAFRTAQKGLEANHLPKELVWISPAGEALRAHFAYDNILPLEERVAE